jgi:hypothetical protein
VLHVRLPDVEFGAASSGTNYAHANLVCGNIFDPARLPGDLSLQANWIVYGEPVKSAY